MLPRPPVTFKPPIELRCCWKIRKGGRLCSHWRIQNKRYCDYHSYVYLHQVTMKTEESESPAYDDEEELERTMVSIWGENPPEEEGEASITNTNTNTNCTTVYVLINNCDALGTVSNSFYAIDIPNPNPPHPPPPPPHPLRPSFIPLSPILTFDAMTYPHGMRSVKYCSKFYFLGGQYLAADGSEDSPLQIFPPDVYIYDPIRRSLSAGVPMTTGKPDPLFFELDGKLYVIGDLAAHGRNYVCDHPIPDSRVDELDSRIRHFEVFDPSTNCWTPLKDPPKLPNRLYRWTRCAVVNRKVLLSGDPIFDPDDFYEVLLVLFNFDTQEWTKLPPPAESVQPPPIFTSSPELLGGGGDSGYTFYGLSKQRIAKLGPFTEDELGQYEDKLFTHRVRKMSSVRSAYVDAVVPLGLKFSWSMCHLGERLFCFVRSGSGVRYGLDSSPVKDARFIQIKLFKEEQEEETTCINNVVDAENNKDSSFEGKYVYGANYLVKTSLCNLGSIGACYALYPEEKKKLKKKMKKSKRKKNGYKQANA